MVPKSIFTSGFSDPGRALTVSLKLLSPGSHDTTLCIGMLSTGISPFITFTPIAIEVFENLVGDAVRAVCEEEVCEQWRSLRETK